MTDINAGMVKTLIDAQFPQWSDLSMTPVMPGGWDNRTFRLGDEMLVRLPSACRYVAQVAKEQKWLPILGPRLPLPIPVPLALGRPGDGYAWPWSIYAWHHGAPIQRGQIRHLARFAADLASFLIALQAIDVTGGPAAGEHNFHRGGSLSVYDGETRQAIARLSDEIDPSIATEIWNAARTSTWCDAPVWVHGDVAEGNLLVREDRLCAVIDFGSMGVGDPACDLTVAWTLFDGPSREIFRAALPLDPATWNRGRAWALWKALITLEQIRHTDAVVARRARQTIREIVIDHRQSGAQG